MNGCVDKMTTSRVPMEGQDGRTALSRIPMDGQDGRTASSTVPMEGLDGIKRHIEKRGHYWC